VFVHARGSKWKIELVKKLRVCTRTRFKTEDRELVKKLRVCTRTWFKTEDRELVKELEFVHARAVQNGR